MRSLFLSLCLALPGLAAAPVYAQTPQVNYAYLFQNFSEDGLTRADKRFLQTSLAFEGDYNGLIDGDWGPMSRRALDSYARRAFDTPAETWHMAALAIALVVRIDAEGWTLRHFDGLNMSMLFPARTAVLDPPTNDLVNWRHRGSSLAYSVGVQSRARAEEMHAYTLSRHQSATEPYTLRNPGLAVTRIRRADGAVLYARSDYTGNGWSTVLLSADRTDEALLNAVSASLAPGPVPPLSVTRGGKLDAAIRQAFEVMDQVEQADKAAPHAPQAPVTSATASTGSGFYVSSEGHVLTNAHVVDDCATITVDSHPARLLATSDSDLALLATDAPHATFATFTASPARLNADVTAVGYPLSHILGGLNVTRGAVSSMTGLAGDPATMQITAPVQPGNSGGPLIGPDGSVVGVVVAKLDALSVADSLGDIPQNVNFAIRADRATTFLSDNGLSPEIKTDTTRLAPEDLAEQAAAFTAFIECSGM